MQRNALKAVSNNKKSSAKLQDTRSIYKFLLYFYKLAMNNIKNEINNTIKKY